MSNITLPVESIIKFDHTGILSITHTKTVNVELDQKLVDTYLTLMGGSTDDMVEQVFKGRANNEQAV